MDYFELKKLVSPRITLKGIKTFRGMDGVGLNATLYFDGIKVADVLDEGCGGMLHFYWKDRTAEVQIEAFIASLNIPVETVKYEGGSYESVTDLEHIVNTMVDGMTTEKRLRKICKTKTVVRQTDGEYIALGIPFSPAIKPRVVAEFGAKFAAIVNEEL